MEDIKKLADEIRKNPEQFKGKNVIIGLGDDEKADILFMCGNPLVLTEMLQVFIDDLKPRKEIKN